ncbi:MAG TPA: pyridoxamine 5'-phosphate oxidase family protein [Noviherbaspirillum sp.]
MHDATPQWRVDLDAQLSLHAHEPVSRFVQVATIRRDGRPANRTMTFRLFLSGHRLLFTADAHTEKIAELEKCPWAEICWYFPEARWQARILGTMHVAHSEDEELEQARRLTWHERTEESRQSFTWPRAGEPLSPLPAFRHPTPMRPPENFSLLVLTPDRVETLDLSCHPHVRELHTCQNGDWTSGRINP